MDRYFGILDAFPLESPHMTLNNWSYSYTSRDVMFNQFQLVSSQQETFWRINVVEYKLEKLVERRLSTNGGALPVGATEFGSRAGRELGDGWVPEEEETNNLGNLIYSPSIWDSGDVYYGNSAGCAYGRSYVTALYKLRDAMLEAREEGDNPKYLGLHFNRSDSPYYFPASMFVDGESPSSMRLLIIRSPLDNFLEAFLKWEQEHAWKRKLIDEKRRPRVGAYSVELTFISKYLLSQEGEPVESLD